jgi:hypothetical protein
MKEISHLIYYKFTLINSDLKALSIELKNHNKDASKNTWFIFLKQALVILTNLHDSEKEIRNFYQDISGLSEIYKKILRELKFARYIRNKFIGHIHNGLIQKAIEWRPELITMVHNHNSNEKNFIVNLFVLETLINTYVDEDGRHLYFKGDLDLLYPKDFRKFITMIDKSVKIGLEFTNFFLESTFVKPNTNSSNEKAYEMFFKAGETEFNYLKKSNKR